MMKLVRDVLDKKLMDSEDSEVGRVDGVRIEFPEGQPPRMIQLEIGGDILAARVANWLVKPTRWMAEHFGPRRKAVIAIDWKHVERMGQDIHLDIKADDTESLAWEHWLRDRFIAKIPGGA
jgi:sporulation protein YlmC with PRC-barrel domain